MTCPEGNRGRRGLFRGVFCFPRLSMQLWFIRCGFQILRSLPQSAPESDPWGMGPRAPVCLGGQMLLLDMHGDILLDSATLSSADYSGEIVFFFILLKEIGKGSFPS